MQKCTKATKEEEERKKRRQKTRWKKHIGAKILYICSLKYKSYLTLLVCTVLEMNIFAGNKLPLLSNLYIPSLVLEVTLKILPAN